MANISKIKLPNGNIYDIKPSSDACINTDGVFYIISNNVTINNYTNVTSITSTFNNLPGYYEGLKIVLNYTYNTISTTNVKLNINGLGKKNICNTTSSITLEEGLKPGGVYHLVYTGTYFIMDGYVNTVPNVTMDYANPVAGGSGSEYGQYVAGKAITTNSLVYRAKNGFIYPVEASAGGNIDFDWGLAFCANACSSGGTISANSLLQNTTIDISTDPSRRGTSPDSSSCPLYAMYSTSESCFIGNIVDISLESNAYTAPFNGMAGITTTQQNVADTFICLGSAKNSSLSSKYTIYLDLSNHDFITMSNTFTTIPNVNTLTNNTINSINGRNIGANLAGQGVGECSSHTGGGSTRLGPWTGTVDLPGYELIPNSVVAVHFTDYPEAGSFLNINGKGAFQMLLNGNATTVSTIADNSIVIFLFDGSAYNIIAGYGGGGTYEVTSNKTQYLDANSTPMQYPSAKCVYDIIGNIETLLQEI